MREAGVELSDADGGSIDLASFLEFIRRTLVADLPSSKLEHIKALFTSTAREGGGGGGGGGGSGGGAGDGVGGAKAGAARSLGCNGAAAATPLPHTHTLAGAGGGTNMHPAGSGGGCPSTGGASTPMGTPHSGGSGVGSRAARLPLAPSLDGIVEVAGVSGAGGRDGSASADGGGVVSKAQTEWMLNQLGCTLDESTFTEIFDEVDSDSDGHLILGEFITAIGMLKQNMLEVLDLEQSFTRLRDDARLAARASLAEAPPGGTPATSPLAKLRMRGSVARGLRASTSETPPPPRPALLEHCIYASDLVATLHISEEEAEEMIFIADFKDNQAIDFTEFKQVVVNWSK